jgi:thymidylate kinase
MFKYIVIEGIHGSGKSTVTKQLTETLKTKGINAQYLHFPNEEEDLGKIIRKTLADQDLYKHREVLGLLYAAASNAFHIKSRDDDKIYVLERDSVTTGLIFQKDMPRETRLENYKFGIKNLREQGIVVYVTIDKAIALQRLTARNEALKTEGEVRKDKANDKFIEDFDRLSHLYSTEMMPQLDKL